MNPSESDSSPQEPYGLQVELAAKSRSRVRAIWVVLMLVFLAIVTGATLIGWSPSPSLSPTPSPSATVEQSSSNQTITWSPNSIDIILSPGESASRSFTVTSSTDLTNVRIEAVSAISPFLTLKPSIVSKLRANKPQTVQMSFATSTTAVIGTYTGTIHLRVGVIERGNN